MEKAELQEHNGFLYVIYFRNKQNIHISFFGFDRNFDHPGINVAFKFSPKRHNFSTMKKFFVEVTFDR